MYGQTLQSTVKKRLNIHIYQYFLNMSFSYFQPNGYKSNLDYKKNFLNLFVGYMLIVVMLFQKYIIDLHIIGWK